MTRETVFLETLAKRAMSLMVDRLRLRSFSVGSVDVAMLQESDVIVHDVSATKLYKTICLGAENTGFWSGSNFIFINTLTALAVYIFPFYING